MDAGLRIIFAGEVLDGFDRDAVKRNAAARLGVGAEMVEQIFSGRPVILKKGLTLDAGRRYVILLERLGMRAWLAPANGLGPVDVRPPAPKRAEEDFDPERTHIAGPDALRAFAAALGGSPAETPAGQQPEPPAPKPAAAASPAPVAAPAPAQPASSAIVPPQMAASDPATEIPAHAPPRPYAPIPKTEHVPAPETVLDYGDEEMPPPAPRRGPLGRYAFWAGVLCALLVGAWLLMRAL